MDDTLVIGLIALGIVLIIAFCISINSHIKRKKGENVKKLKESSYSHNSSSTSNKYDDLLEKFMNLSSSKETSHSSFKDKNGVQNGVSLDLKIKNFLNNNFTSHQAVKIVLDSSCVKCESEELNKLAKTINEFNSDANKASVTAFVTSSAYYELLLLLESPIYAKNAKIILKDICQWKKTSYSWHNLYSRSKNSKSFNKSLTASPKIFVFFDSLLIYEFLNNTNTPNNVYILDLDPITNSAGLGPSNNHDLLRESINNNKQFRPKADINGNDENIIVSDNTFVAKDTTKTITINGSNLKQTENSGSEGEIYTADNFHNKCIKIYKKKNATEYKYYKLIKLLEINKASQKKLSTENLALPDHIILQDRNVVGFSMKWISNMEDIRSIILKNKFLSTFTKENRNLKKEIAKKVALLVLEMRMCDLYMPDLNLSNVVIAGDLKGKFDVMIIDNDSFQYRNYLSSAISTFARHPSTYEEFLGKPLLPEHFSFIFGVFLFRLYQGNRFSPLYKDEINNGGQIEQDAYKWGYHIFPYLRKEGSEIKKYDKSWKESFSENERECIKKGFRFKGNYSSEPQSMGDYIREFHLHSFK